MPRHPTFTTVSKQLECEQNVKTSARTPLFLIPAVCLVLSVPAATTPHADLLRHAYDGACLMPDVPHLRDRCAAQDRLVETALELDKPELAAEFADGIANWRRARSYADIAKAYAICGDEKKARLYLDKAKTMTRMVEQIAAGDIVPAGDKKELAESLQEWRLDRVKVHMANAYLYLGAREKAAAISDATIEEERMKLNVVEAELASASQFDEVVVELVALASAGDFEPKKQALEGLLELHQNYFSDAEKRAKLENLIEQFGANMPLFLQIGYGQRLAETAVEHEDPAAALTWLNTADEKIEATGFRPRMYFPMKSRNVVLFHRAGEDEKARAGAQKLRTAYAEKRALVFDIHRAKLLCNTAEAYAALGDSETALEIYARAIKEGQVNGNARPRADDLVDISCSIAVSRVAPTDSMLSALETMKGNLGAPW